MYLVSYDITDDRRRAKIAKELENFGTRVQYSVFECDLDRKRFDELYNRLCHLMAEEEEGNIRIYSICRNCMDKLMTIGIEIKGDIREDLIIV